MSTIIFTILSTYSSIVMGALLLQLTKDAKLNSHKSVYVFIIFSLIPTWCSLINNLVPLLELLGVFG